MRPRALSEQTFTNRCIQYPLSTLAVKQNGWEGNLPRLGILLDTYCLQGAGQMLILLDPIRPGEPPSGDLWQTFTSSLSATAEIALWRRGGLSAAAYAFLLFTFQ